MLLLNLTSIIASVDYGQNFNTSYVVIKRINMLAFPYDSLNFNTSYVVIKP